MRGKQKAQTINSETLHPHPTLPPPAQSAERLVSHITGSTTPMYISYLCDESVRLLIGPVFAWRAGRIS